MQLTDLSRARWRTSSHSGSNGECVEVAASPDRGRVFVRDTRDRAGATLGVTPAGWRAFLTVLCTADTGQRRRTQ
jgi:hypothetical protein